MAINETSLRQELHKWIDTLEGDHLLQLWKIRRHLTLSQSSPELDGADWINIAVAAPLLSLSFGHLSRLCRAKLAGAGHARMGKPADAGKPTWFIARSFDPILLNARSAPAG